MADQEADQLKEGTEAIEDKTSFSYRMEHPDEADDHVASVQDQETQEEKEAREAAEAEAAAGSSEEETPEAKAAREVAEAAAAEEDKPKFATVEEYHKAHKGLETRMHEATTETAKEKTAREAAEARAEAAETKLAEQEAERERLAAEAARPKPMSEDEQDAVFEKAAEELRDLDNTDPDYLKNYGKIWRKAINAAGQNRTSPDPEMTADEVATKAWEKFQAKQAAESAKTAEERQREEESRVELRARDLGLKAGLDLNDPESADSIIWDRLKSKIPKEIFDKGTLEAQVEWVAAGIRQKTGKVVEQTDAERAAALAAQKNNTVMGKGVNFTPPKEAPKKRTLSEIMDSTSP